MEEATPTGTLTDGELVTLRMCLVIENLRHAGFVLSEAAQGMRAVQQAVGIPVDDGASVVARIGYLEARTAKLRDWLTRLIGGDPEDPWAVGGGGES